MASEKQMQKAGDNSNQLQIANATFVCGVDEKRVREVCNEIAVEAIKTCTAEATEKAIERIEKFTTTLIPRIERIEHDFRSFSDPAFQFLLQSSQKTAACTDHEADYELLSELLVHRIEKGHERKNKASIAKAVEIVDQIDDDALCALSVAYSIRNFVPLTGNISQGLSELNNLFESLCYRELPNDSEWVFHLDILDAVRMSSFGSFKKLEDFYPDNIEGYVSVGIEKGSENYTKAINILSEEKLPFNLLVDNELLKGFVRLNIRSKDSIDDTVFISMNGYPGSTRNLNRNEIQALNSVWELYSKDTTQMELVKKAFVQKWDEFPALNKVRAWWNLIPNSFTITPIGNVLAHANAKRCHKGVPDIQNR